MVPADSRRIPRVPRYSGAGWLTSPDFGYGAVTRCGHAFLRVPLSVNTRTGAGPTTPGAAERPPRFGLLRVRSPLLAQSLLFSFPAGTEMFQFPAFAPRASARGVGIAPDGFPHSDIRGSTGICPYPRLFAACHVLRRLREPQASPMRPFLLSLFLSLARPASRVRSSLSILHRFFLLLAFAVLCVLRVPIMSMNSCSP